MSSQRGFPFVFALLAALAAGILSASSARAAAPTITSFTPTSGKLNTPVTITGANFAAPATVAFGGVASVTVTVNSATQITATVPTTAPTGPITVTTSGGTATSTATFTVVPGVILSPAVTPPGSAATLYFSGLGTYEAVDLYFDSTDLALVTSTNTGAGSLPLTIPTTATPGIHWLSAVGRHSGAAAQVSFTVRTDWVQLGFRANRRGRNALENVLSSDVVGGVEEAWRTPAFGAVYNTCADVGGIIYACFGDGSVRAFAEATGVQKWAATTSANAGMYSTPAVVGGIVYVGSSDTFLYAFDANTGALKWRYPTSGSVYSSPCVKGGVVYFGSFDSNVYALNATTGALLWKYQTGGNVFGGPAIFNGIVYIGSEDDKVYALNAATGALIWTYTTGSYIAASPAVVGGVVYIGSNDDSMYALDALTGRLKWSYLTGGPVLGTAAVARGHVYVCSEDEKAYAFNAANGALVWTFTSPGTTGLAQTTCVAAGVVYTGDIFHTYALDADYGGLLATLPLGTIYGGVIVVNGVLIAGDAVDGVIAEYTLTGANNDATSARPDPSLAPPSPSAVIGAGSPAGPGL